MQIDEIRRKMGSALIGLGEGEGNVVGEAKLTETQQKRANLFLDGKSIQEIAEMEEVSRESVLASLESAAHKLTMARKKLV